VIPPRAVEGGRITIEGHGFPVEETPAVTIGEVQARVAFASAHRLVVVLPSDVEGGRTPIRVEGVTGTTAYVSVGGKWATGLHQVDSPVFDASGNLFVTYSGSRGQETPVSIFRVTPAGTREPFAAGIVNATSMALGPEGNLYVSSRFEGAVYRIGADGTHEQVASDLGVACGIAFDTDGRMYVGDRSGTIFRVQEGHAAAFATLPPSVAAFHLAMSPSNDLYVTAPTLGSYDHLYRVDRQGQVQVIAVPMGRPQGLAFALDGTLHIVDALAGASGLYRFVHPETAPELVVSGASLVGVAFGPSGELVVTSNDTAYRFDELAA
jgi:sugar lactone lactonase YvrE